MLNIKCAYSDIIETHKLVPHPKNPNRHPQDQIDRLAKLIDYQGWRHPIIVSRRSGYVVAGHARLEAANQLALHQVPVDYQDFDSDEQEYTFLVSDNAIAEFYSETDLAAVNLDMADLGPFDIDLLGIKDFLVDISEKPSDKEELNEGLEGEKAHQCPKCGHNFDEFGD